MALIKTSSLFFTCLMILLVTLFGVAFGETVHKVGDSKGWTIGVDYESWAASRTFQVGDSLVFQYNNESHDVTQVTLNDSVLCNTSKPLTKYQTGSDTVTLTEPGVYNFIDGVPNHCEMGQKVQILVVLPASMKIVTAIIPAIVAGMGHNYSPSQLPPSPIQSGASSNTANWISTFSLMAMILAF